MSEVPVIVAEVTAADWAAAGPGWTHLPDLARFRAERLPASWDGFFTGRHHAVLESGRSGSLTIAVPAAARATVFFADGRVVLHAGDGAHEEAAEQPLGPAQFTHCRRSSSNFVGTMVAMVPGAIPGVATRA